MFGDTDRSTKLLLNIEAFRDASNWSKAYSKQLADTHWVGGNPLNGEVYGYAGWADKKGVLSLRNPTSRPKTFVVHVKQVLDIPNGYNNIYSFYNAKTNEKLPLYKGDTFLVKLAPFEVKVMEAK